MEVSKNRFYVKIGIAIIISIVIFVFATSLVIFIAYFFLNSSKNENGETESWIREYKMLKVNKERNETIVGFAALPTDLNEEEFLSYSDQLGNSILISNFGSKEYMCTGVCFFQPIDERRSGSSASLVSKGMTYLVAAATAYGAYELAKEYFRTECKRVWEHEERVHDYDYNIEGENCDAITIEWDEEIESIKYPPYTDDEDIKFRRRFMCKGNCQKNIRDHEVIPMKNNEEWSKSADQFYRKQDCSQMGLMKKMEIRMNAEDYILEAQASYAMNRFYIYMSKFCRHNTVVESPEGKVFNGCITNMKTVHCVKEEFHP